MFESLLVPAKTPKTIGQVASTIDIGYTKHTKTSLQPYLSVAKTYGLNSVFWALRRARRSGAWPANLDLDRLTADNFVAHMGAQTVELPFAQPAKPVFLRTHLGEQRHWTSMTVFHNLAKLSAHLKLHRNVQTHTLRSSGACRLLAAGASVKDIQDQLAHKRSGKTYRRYISNMASANVSAAVFDTTDTSFVPMMELHPDRLLEEIASDEAIPTEQTYEVCVDESRESELRDDN